MLILCKKILAVVGFTALLVSFSAQGATYSLSPSTTHIGKMKTTRAMTGDTLSKIAERYGIGNLEMAQANPQIGHKTIQKGTQISLPGQFILPTTAERKGIVINLATLRAFYFSPDGKKVSTYPIGIGREGWSTPQGKTTVISKQKDPAWRPPESIKRESARKGKILPSIVPAGPNNPLGQYAIRLGITGILIHGTTQPASVGLRSSHGCIRMFANDIKDLFGKVEAGTPVQLIFEPHHDN